MFSILLVDGLCFDEDMNRGTTKDVYYATCGSKEKITVLFHGIKKHI